MKVKYDLEERLLEFATRIVKLSEALPRTVAGRHIASQMLRSGTSPLGQHGEAQSAESRKDFVHKLKIGLKELRETQRWLWLIQRVPLIENPNRIEPLLAENDELIRIFVASVETAQNNLSRIKEGDEALICYTKNHEPLIEDEA